MSTQYEMSPWLLYRVLMWWNTHIAHLLFNIAQAFAAAAATTTCFCELQFQFSFIRRSVRWTVDTASWWTQCVWVYECESVFFAFSKLMNRFFCASNSPFTMKSSGIYWLLLVVWNQCEWKKNHMIFFF